MDRYDLRIFIISFLLLLITIGCAHEVQKEDVPQITGYIEETEMDAEPIEEPIEEQIEEEPIPTDRWESLGEFTVTAYCPCYSCSGKWGDMTSTGIRATSGRTIAVDPKVISYGSQVMVGDTVYVAEDCGGAIKGNRIDVFHTDHNKALEFGKQRLEVYVRVSE